MSLCRDYTCTRCQAPAHGIPFGPVGEEWCSDCWFRTQQEAADMLALQQAAREGAPKKRTRKKAKPRVVIDQLYRPGAYTAFCLDCGAELGGLRPPMEVRAFYRCLGALGKSHAAACSGKPQTDEARAYLADVKRRKPEGCTL